TVTEKDNANVKASSVAMLAITDVGPSVQSIPTSSAASGTPVTLQAHASNPNQFASETYAWSVILNNVTRFTGSGQQFTFTPGDEGVYTVSVTVTDDAGKSVSTSTTVSVVDAPPTAIFSNNGPVPEGTTATAGFTNQVDPTPGHNLNVNPLHYSYALAPGQLAGNYATASIATSVQLVLSEEGTYRVYGRIFNEDDRYTDYFTDVTITDAPLQASAVPAMSTAEGDLLNNLVVATFTDPGATEISPTFDYSAVIAWGDGATSSADVTIGYNSGKFSVIASHT